MAEGAALLLVEAPGEARDALAREATERGATVHTRDDAMQALAELSDMRPEVVLVGADPGPPGAMSLCRILERKLHSATIYRLGDPSERAVLESRARCLPLALSAVEVLDQIMPAEPGSAEPGLSKSEVLVEGLQFVRVLLRASDHGFSGRLWVTDEDGERELYFLHGVAVASRGDVASERLGQLALELQMFDTATLDEALDRARALGIRLGEALLAQGAIDGAQLHRLLSEQHMRRLTALCLAGACRLRVSPGTGDVPSESLLRLAPLSVLTRALLSLPQDERAGLLNPLLPGGFVLAARHRETDRLLAQVGILDLSALLPHAKSLASLRDLIASALDPEPDLSASDILLLLLWSGCLQVKPESDGLQGLPPGRLTTLLTALELPPLPSFKASQAPELPQAVRDYLLSHGSAERPRIERVLAGPADEASSDLSALLARYHTDRVQRSPLRVLRIDNSRRAPEVRRAYLAAVKALDGLPEAQDGYALAARRAELRAIYEHAFATLATVEESGDGETAAALAGPTEDDEELEAMAEAISIPAQSVELRAGPPPPLPPAGKSGVSSEMELLVQQTRWADLIQLLESSKGTLDKATPGVRLLYAVALREASRADNTDGSPTAKSPESMAIDALSSMLHTSSGSAIPLVLAKRILRQRRPIEWNQAPSGRLSLLVGAFALIAGTAVGLWLQHSGTLDGLLVSLTYAQ